ncbi:MAG: TolB protein [Solirubrobacterales bacterium]|jgi:Tol biopolymer transport system component|nr:TolB protein [Solirubrobacterales bacterium]
MPPFPVRGLVLILVSVATLAASVLPAAADAAWPGRNGPVVYVGLDPAPDPIHTAADYLATGLRSFVPGLPGSVRQLTTDPTDRDPKVSPDGRRIVFSRTLRTEPGVEVTGIFAIAIDGTGLTQVTAGGPDDAGDVEPAFYPSGDRIAFVRGGDLYAARLDGSGLRLLASGYASLRTPAVSPTGRQIVFACRHFEGEVESSDEHICSIRPDGSHRRDLTPRFEGGDRAYDPDFSPDGRLIAFSIGPGTASDVFTMRANGSRFGALTNRGPRGGRRFPRARGYDNPAFAPAGGVLIAVARSGVRPRFVRIPLNGDRRPENLEAAVLGRSPVWAPAP